ncbi:hypothetical protein NC653_029037 [Populus alba x Populus x berolinensis]|uniref:Mitochondrial transcription termination factor family protein n=1 Tax=Populus alba x Populus x berolinensis TaxID=444605 RepID=A0AAD6Q2W6_9ROSI|nr:hypothetical protein NC653_029037 [Populus alba x Populus x berolinensis]
MSYCFCKTILHHHGIHYLRLSPTHFIEANSHQLFLLPVTRCISSSANPNQHSFAASYLIKKCGFSPESALSASKHLKFETPEKPDSVIDTFRRYGFPEDKIFKLVKKFPKAIAVAKTYPFIIYHRPESYLQPYVSILRENGIPKSHIASLIYKWPRTVRVCPIRFRNTVETVKEMGFDPSKLVFTLAVLARSGQSKSGWEKKVGVYKRWGWSDEEILAAFKRNPWCMMSSEDKIMAGMDFLINNMGCESSYVAEHPILLLLSLEKRLIPRASVLQFLQSNKLIDEKPNLATLFKYSEKSFLHKFVDGFDEAPQLLKLYREKLNLSK